MSNTDYNGLSYQNTSAEIKAIRTIEHPELNIIENYYREIVSFSHVMGHITAILVDYIRSAFNDKYFKTIWNSMEVPYSQRSKSFRDMMLKPRPAMLIVPKFDPSDEPRFIPQEEFDGWVPNTPNNIYNIGNSKLGSSIVSKYNNYTIFTKLRNYKMQFTIHFTFDSDIQKIQCQEYIRQSIRHRMTNVIYRYLENNIPESYLKEIARINCFDYKSEEFLKFLNTYSRQPITRRFRGGSGNTEFFWMNKSSVNITFTSSPQSNDPIRKGNIDISSSFTENVMVEFSAPSIYFMTTIVSNDIYKPYIERPLIEENTMHVVGVNVYGPEIPSIPELDENNYKLLFSITVQADKQGMDTLELFDFIKEPEILHMIEFYENIKRKIDFISVVVRENCDVLQEPRYYMNFETFTLTIYDMDMYKSYYVSMYIDRRKLDSINEEFFETDKIKRLEWGKENISDVNRSNGETVDGTC